MTNSSRSTTIKWGNTLSWTPIADHIGLYHQEIASASEADALQTAVSSVLREKIEVGGAVLPHYHSVAEIIHITVGKVRVLCNGEWLSGEVGDTFHVPAGSVHSVRNADVAPTEQISIFLPVSPDYACNRFFDTTKVDVPLEKLTAPTAAITASIGEGSGSDDDC